jgi:transcriptional regulator GlxA family with amidase domain
MNQRIQIQTHNPSRNYTLSQLALASAYTQDPDNSMLEKLQLAIAKLLEAVDSALSGDRAAAEECMSSVGTLLRPAVSDAPVNVDTRLGRAATETTDTVRAHGPIRGGLAPWQVRQVTTHIDMQLGSSITTDDLARIARLSPCHFSRAFRESFGDSPHKYVMRRRVERAQGLMLATELSLGQIAVECGLADQAHLCKLFQKIAGESPGVWRRARSSR